MIHTEPAMTRPTISAPKASASTLLVLSGAGGDVQEEDEVDAHLRDRQRREPHHHARPVEERGAARHPERGDGQRQPRARGRSRSSAPTSDTECSPKSPPSPGADVVRS